MWYDKIDRINFIKQIYTEIPDLINVKIHHIALKREGEEVSIIFDMPLYPDNPPTKWNGNNTVSVELSCFVISEFKLEMKDKYKNGNINIYNHEDKIQIIIDGTISCSLVAEVVFIQKVTAYINNCI